VLDLLTLWKKNWVFPRNKNSKNRITKKTGVIPLSPLITERQLWACHAGDSRFDYKKWQTILILACFMMWKRNAMMSSSSIQIKTMD
jgi:hypothetical protein